MTAVVIVILILIVIVAGVLLVVKRRPRQDAGMSSFQRHIDALSPESRREVQDRARKHQQDDR